MAHLQKYVCVGLALCLLILIKVSLTTGTNCEDDEGCGAHGSCPQNTAPCVCTDGYTDDTCSTHPCATGGTVCGDHGTCDTANTPSEKCDCNDGYTGDLCETGPVCTSSGTECGDNGKCVTSNKPYICECSNGYSGETCETAPSSSSVVHLSALLMSSFLLWFVV